VGARRGEARALARGGARAGAAGPAVPLHGLREHPRGGAGSVAGTGALVSLVGARVVRKEDPRLLTGAGAYVDDLHLPGMVHAAVLRSPFPHARVGEADVSGAGGTLLVLTPQEVAEATRPIRNIWVLPGQRQTSYPVVPVVARHVGEALGLVVAGTRAAAEDAAEALDLGLDPLPSVSHEDAAPAEDAPLPHPDRGPNAVAD